MKSTVVDESLSSYKPMYCSREYQTSTRLNQQYEKSTLNDPSSLYIIRRLVPLPLRAMLMVCCHGLFNRYIRYILHLIFKKKHKVFICRHI